MDIRKRYTKVCLFLWVIGMCFCAHPIKAQSVIPVPLKMEQGTGSFLLSEKTKLYTNLQGEEAALLGDYLKTALSLQFKEGKKKDKQNVLSLLISEKNPLLVSPESYILSVTPEHILIKASSVAGLFYGIQTLLQLSQPSGTDYSITSVDVQDTPRFAYRGMMLDVSRHFLSKEFVKKQIDALAFYKINRLHLHLTDAAGWRLEIKQYPLLTEFAAWRTDANWKKKYKTAEYKAGPKAPLSPEITGIFPDTKLEIAAVIASHCTMMFGTNTRTNPIKISTLKVDAHFLTTLVPKSAITKINAAMINVHTQYGIPNSI